MHRTVFFHVDCLGPLTTALRVMGAGRTVLLTAFRGTTRRKSVVLSRFTANTGRTWRTVKLPTAGLPRRVVLAGYLTARLANAAEPHPRCMACAMTGRWSCNLFGPSPGPGTWRSPRRQ